MQVKDLNVSPVLVISLTNTVGEVPLGSTCIQVIDPLRGTITVAPVPVQAARDLAAMLLQYVEKELATGGTDGSSAMHE